MEILSQYTAIGNTASSVPEKKVSKSVNEFTIPDSVKPAIETARQNKKNVFLVSVQIDPSEPIKWLRAELLIKQLAKAGEVLHLEPEESSFQTEQFTGEFFLILESHSKHS